MGWFRRNEHDEEQLSAYLDGELSARQAENVEKHLAVCDACAALLEELRSTRALLSALPTQMARRSFVLGAEHARATVRQAAPPRRFGLALAPAVAATVLVGLLLVDFADFSSSSSDEGAQLTAAFEPRPDDDTTNSAGSLGTSGGAGASASQAESGTATDSTALKNDEATGPQPTPAPAEGGAGGTILTPESPPSVMSAEALPTPAPDTARNAAAAGEAEEAPSPGPVAIEAQDESGGGLSALRVLEIVAAAVLLASGFYVFGWHRVSRGGS